MARINSVIGSKQCNAVLALASVVNPNKIVQEGCETLMAVSGELPEPSVRPTVLGSMSTLRLLRWFGRMSPERWCLAGGGAVKKK